MLQSIRDRTQGWIASIIISLLILSFALWGIHSYFMGGSVSNTVAEVNGIDITKGQLAIAYERLRKQFQSQNNSTDELNSNTDASLKERALQALINIQVLKQTSLQQNYYISAVQVDSYLESMPEFQVDGQFSLIKFKQALASTMYTPIEFLDLIKTSLLIDQPRLGTIFSSFSLPNEINDTIALVNQERDIDYVLIPNQEFANLKVNISSEMVKKYYEQHQDEYKTPEQVSVEFIELNIQDLIDKVKISDAELKNYYNENTNAFADPMKWKIEMLTIPLSDHVSQDMVSKVTNIASQMYEKAKEGIDLNALTKLYPSVDAKVSTEKWVTQNQIPSELQSAILSMTKSGQITNPVKTSDGIVLLKVIEFTEAQPAPFEKVKQKVKDSYAHQKAQELFSDLREKLANLTYQHPESLEFASKELGLPIKKSENFTIDKGLASDISANSKIREAAFSNDVLTMQNNSDVIQKNADTAVVIRIKSHSPSSLLSLKVVQQQITEKLKISEVNKNAEKQVRQIIEQLNAGINPQIALKNYRVIWNHVGFLPRHSTKVNSALLDTAFGMPKPLSGQVTYEMTKVPTGYAIVGLKAVHNGKAANKEEYDVYAEQTQNTQGLLEYGLYKLSAMNNAKIINK